jgi:hypothetical protein
MSVNSKIINTFDIKLAESKELCLIDPMILFCIIITICLTLYVIGYKLSKQDYK